MTTANPKECPFCGTDDVETDGCEGGWYVCCNSCGAIGPNAESEREAVVFWNERVL